MSSSSSVPVEERIRTSNVAGDASKARERPPKPKEGSEKHRAPSQQSTSEQSTAEQSSRGASQQRLNPSLKRTSGSILEHRTETSRVTTRETLVSRHRDAERGQQTQRRKNPKADAPGAETPSFEPVVPQPSWDPTASLIAPTTAPLATRVCAPPSASHAPVSLQPRNLNDMSLESQEASILEDLLSVLMGYEGRYIRFTRGYDNTMEQDRIAGPGFSISPGLDRSLKDLTISILKVATHYIATEAFIEVQSRAEFGLVNHALCAAIRKRLHDYLVLVGQLESQFLTNPAFTLHVLNIHILPASHLMFQIYTLARDLSLRNALLRDHDSEDDFGDVDHILKSLRDGEVGHSNLCIGGNVLGLVTHRLESMAGDPFARAFLMSLLNDASRPYMMMLNKWLHHGIVQDPHGEFMIREQRSIRRERLEEDYTDEYWDRRYTIRDDVPPQLQAVKAKILLAGKYLNVVRECRRVDVKAVPDSPQSFGDARLLENVNEAYSHANESLLQLLLTTYDLPMRFHSLKNYFCNSTSCLLSSSLEPPNFETSW